MKTYKACVEADVLFSIKGHICPIYLISDWLKIIINRMPADKNTRTLRMSLIFKK